MTEYPRSSLREPVASPVVRGVNAAAACLHLAQGVAVILLGRDWRAPVLDEYSEWALPDGCESLDDCCNKDNVCSIKRRYVKVGELSLKWEIVAFFWLSALFQGLVALMTKEAYGKWIAQKRNPARWAEYSLSAAVMSVIIAQLNGLVTVYYYVWVAGLTAALMFLGWTHEQVLTLRKALCRVEQKHRAREGISDYGYYRYFGLFAAWIVFLALKLPILANFIGTIRRAREGGGSRPPEGVYAVVFVQTFLYATFGLVHTFRVFRVGPWRRGEAVELSYIVLSLTSKSFLCWLLYTSVLMRDGRLAHDE